MLPRVAMLCKLAPVLMQVFAAVLICGLVLATPTPARAQQGGFAGGAGGMATLLADALYLDGPGRLIAQGNVEVLYGATRLQAQRVIYDRGTDRVFLEGPLLLNYGAGVIVLADQAELSQDLERGLIRSARVVLDQQLQIAASDVVRHDARFTEMANVVASSCEVCASRPTPLWEIRAARVIHDDEDMQVYFDSAQLRVFGLPVAYIPRLRIPDPRLTRATGFLTPRFSVDSGHGVGLRSPYFIVLGPDKDLTLTPFIATQGTRALDWRYRQAFASGMLELGGLAARDRLVPGQTRGFVYATGRFNLPDDWKLDVNLITPSDRTVLSDYQRGQSRLTSDITLERIKRDTRIRAQLLRFQSLRAIDDNRLLPNLVGQAVLEHRRDVAGLGGVAGLRLEVHGHQRRAAFSGLPEPVPGFGAGPRPQYAQRLSLDLDWRRDAVLMGGILGAVGAHIGLDHVRLSDTGGSFARTATRITPNLMAELRWPWVKATAHGASHVIEPVAQVVWGRDRQPLLPNDASRLPELDEGNLFGYDRFAGRDQREAGLRANLGLSWTRFDPTGWSSTLTLGRVWRRTDLGQFSGASPLAGKRSDWLVAGSVSTADGLSVSGRSLLSDNFELRRAALELDWTTPDYSLSTSYIRMMADPFEDRMQTSSEWRFDGQRRLGDFWTAQTSWRYDLEQGRAARAAIGLGYENECLRMEMTLERDFLASGVLSRETNFGLNIDLLGLGGNPSRARRACSDG